MPNKIESNSRQLLGRLRDTMAEEAKGQDRLDKITQLIASTTGTEVCSIYLLRDPETLELCATEGLEIEAVHQTRMRIGEGLVGRVAKTNKAINTADAPSFPGFRYMPETGEERFSSFLGLPIQRLGELLGVLVVQSKTAREFNSDEIYALEVVAMVLAEMAELGAFVSEESGLKALHQQSVLIRGSVAQEGATKGNVWLHEPRVLVTNLVTDDPEAEISRLEEAVHVGVRVGAPLRAVDGEELVQRVVDPRRERLEGSPGGPKSRTVSSKRGSGPASLAARSTTLAHSRAHCRGCEDAGRAGLGLQSSK